MPGQEVISTILESTAGRSILMGSGILLLTYCVAVGIKRGAAYLGKKFPDISIILKEIVPFVNFALYITSLTSFFHFALGFSPAVILGSTASTLLVMGFALRDTIGSIVSGVLLLIDRPFQVGDVISVEEVVGEVMEMGFRFIKVKPHGGYVIIIPNYKCVHANLRVLGVRGEGVLNTVRVCLPMHSNLSKTRLLLKKLASINLYVEPQQPISIYVAQEFSGDGGTGYVITLQCMVKNMEVEEDFRATFLEDVYAHMPELFRRLPPKEKDSPSKAK